MHLRAVVEVMSRARNAAKYKDQVYQNFRCLISFKIYMRLTKNLPKCLYNLFTFQANICSSI